MFEKLMNDVMRHEASEIAKTKNNIKALSAGEVLGSWYYKSLCTPKVFEAVSALEPGESVPDDLIKKMMMRYAREEKKYTARRVNRLTAAKSAHDVDEFTVTVEWVKSRTWGKNPHATVYGRNSITKDFATGCGYDKESAAIAGAFNDNPEVMRILYKHLENNGNDFPYGVHVYGGLVTFDGGCGVSTFYNIFDACGYEFKQVVSGQHCAAYRVTKKA